MLDGFRDVLGVDAVIADADLLESYRRDQTPLVAVGMPLAACLPATATEVADVLRLANEHRIPVVTRGAGSGLAGGANAIDGCIVLSTARMNSILEINPVDQLAVVQPGVLNTDIKQAVAGVGLAYPPDPASSTFSTIGGNIATNAGGLCCLKYGVTRDYVLALEVALADGSLIRTGRRTMKGVAGYDLTALFVGSEGTLGVVTEATLRLRPAAASPSTAVAVFRDVAAAGRAVVAIAAAGVVPALLELMDQTTVRAVEEWQHMDLDPEAGALLLAQADSGGSAGAFEIEVVRRICKAEGAAYVAVTTDADEGAMLLGARRFAYPALERLGATLLDDVAVPRSRIPDLISGITLISERHGVFVGTFGHAGDGNFHPTVVYERDDDAAASDALATFDEIVSLALSLGGTMTGEHGVGLLKARHLAHELGEPTMAAHAAIKRTFDPRGVLNPGKILATRRLM